MDNPITRGSAIDWRKAARDVPYFSGLEFPKMRDPKIELLIGHSCQTLMRGQREVWCPDGAEGPDAKLTALGWTATGSVRYVPCKGRPYLGSGEFKSIALHIKAEAGDVSTSKKKEMSSIEQLLQQMWHIDADKEFKQMLSIESKYVIEKLRNTFKFLEKEGMYKVACTWHPDQPDLPDNRSMALHRLERLERSKLKDPEFRERYASVFKQWLEDDVIREVPLETLQNERSLYWYHHPVIREDKTTTKVRVVMDSAAKFRGRNINEALAPGPNLIANLQAILVRMRINPVAFTGDISSMFLRIRLLPEDRKFHRFVWSFSSKEAPRTYEFLSHVFGNVGSPAVANFVVKEHALKYQKEYPLAFQTVHQSMLVDDVVDSADDAKVAREIIRQLILLHKKAGMELRKWASNSDEALKDLEPSQKAKSVELAKISSQVEEYPVIKTLGLIWQTEEDLFRFEQSSHDHDVMDQGQWTRRKLLSTVAKLFNPLGLLAPYIC